MSDALDLDDLLDDPAAHRRLCALLRLCGSDVMGEKAAAADGLARMAKDRGWMWDRIIPTRSAVLARLERETQIAVANVRRTLEEPPRYNLTHGEKAQAILEAEIIALSPRDRDFLQSMMGWRGRPTERQERYLDALWTRHIRFAGGA